MKKVELEKLNENFVNLIHEGWPVLTVQDQDKVNGMTVNWVQLGWLWNKPVVTVYVRPQRHTFGLINDQDTYSLAFFDETHRKNLSYLGTKSGKDEDKLKNCGYTTTFIDNTPVIDQASLIFTIKKLYVHDLKAEEFIADEVKSSAYPNQDFHRVFIGEITEVFINE